MGKKSFVKKKKKNADDEDMGGGFPTAGEPDAARSDEEGADGADEPMAEPLLDGLDGDDDDDGKKCVDALHV